MAAHAAESLLLNAAPPERAAVSVQRADLPDAPRRRVDRPGR
jgi:hypothetical protein